MRTRRFVVVTVGVMVLSVGLLFTAGYGSGDSPVGAQGVSTPTDLSSVTQHWDKNLPAAQRFVVLAAFNSEAVLDKNTGLVWEKSPHWARATWFDSRFTCLNKNVGGQKGWRLPSIPELTSLIDPSVADPGPTLPPGHPFTKVQSAIYWSATSGAGNPSNAWLVNFSNGLVFTISKTKSSPNLSWCVRGGMNADAY